MKRKQVSISPKRCLFDSLPDEILQLILVQVHHTISQHNTVCKRHYRLLMTFSGWLDVTFQNFRGSFLQLVSFNSLSIYYDLYNCFLELSDLVAKDPRYNRVANAWSYRINTKLDVLTERGHGIVTAAMLKYLGELETAPLKYLNFHPRDFYIHFTEHGHCYSLVIRDEKTQCFRTVYSPIMLDDEGTEVDERNDSENLVKIKKKTYLDDYSEVYDLRSTTTDIHTLFPEFDEDKTIARMMRRKKWHDPAQNKYYGMTPKEIKAQWLAIRREASKKGTAMHLNLERYLNGLSHDAEGKEFAMFCQFEKAEMDGKLRPFRTEWVMFNEDLHLCGSADFLLEYVGDDSLLEFYDPILNPHPKKKRLLLGDHKRSKAINYSPFMSHDADEEEAKEWFGCLPCTAMLNNCNFVYYACQMCYYKSYLEAHYEVEIDDEMFLMVLHPDQLTYLKVIIKASLMAPFFPGILKYRAETLQNKKDLA